MISSTANANQYVGNGVTTNFDFGFEIFSASDVIAVVTTIATGVSQVLISGTDFAPPTASMLNIPTGGYITPLSGGPANLTVPLPSTVNITIIRQRSLLQNTDYKNQGIFYPENHEQSYDNCAMVDQYLFWRLGQVITTPLAEIPGTANLVLPPVITRALKFLSFDASGNVATTIPINPIVNTTSTLIYGLSGLSGGQQLYCTDDGQTAFWDAVHNVPVFLS